MSAAVAALAAQSMGASTAAVIAWVARTLAERHPRIPVLLDLGCGQGDLAVALGSHAASYIGLDAVRYAGLDRRPDIEFHPVDLNASRFPLDDAIADVAVAVETIEHLENPRALVRELVRLTRPGGLVLVTTPNQLSWLSKLSLLCKDEFTAFQERPGLYPTHITALLASDLLHIAQECGLRDPEIHFSRVGRIPGSARNFPAWVSRRFPRRASDNVMLLGWKPVPEARP